MVVNIEDLRLKARRRLPKVVFEYLDGGAEGEVTLRENRLAFEALTFRPRNGVFVPRCDLSTTVLGTELAFPVMLAPCGFTRLLHPQGELAAAHAAGAAGVGYALSTISGYPLEHVKAAGSGPLWYQLYLIGGRAAAEAAIERARLTGCSALVITIDTGAPGMRERDVRNGAAQLVGGSLLSKVAFLPQLLSHPRWLLGFVSQGRPSRLPNVVVPGRGPMPLSEVPAALASTVVTWSDLRWIRAAWPGPIVVKGVLTGHDALRALDEGAAAVVVSNHGGRQLDCVAASIRALPEVVAAVNGRAEVLMDGGVRRGSDIVKALCLGARAVLVGRAFAYGLAAAGESGVARALEILHADLERTVKLLGCAALSELNRSFLDVPSGWLEFGRGAGQSAAR
jgi:L-lactate dehydrogenase (cytochrome)